MSFHYYLKKILSSDDLKRVADTIASAEKTSDGQIRVVVRHHRHLGELKMTPHEIAVKEFHKLGMQHTKHRTGVLILLLFSKGKFEIIGDTGIHEKIADGTWEKIASRMGSHFQKGNFAAGLCEAVAEVGKVLTEHFPRTAEAAVDLSIEERDDSERCKCGSLIACHAISINGKMFAEYSCSNDQCTLFTPFRRAI